MVRKASSRMLTSSAPLGLSRSSKSAHYVKGNKHKISKKKSKSRRLKLDDDLDSPEEGGEVRFFFFLRNVSASFYLIIFKLCFFIFIPLNGIIYLVFILSL
jgi:hypothetical protein